MLKKVKFSLPKITGFAPRFVLKPEPEFFPLLLPMLSDTTPALAGLMKYTIQAHVHTHPQS